MAEHEYLRIERAAERKSEFVRGEMFLMPGGTPKHSMLAANAIVDIGAQLRGKRCRVLTSGMRLRTPAGTHHYPDVSVTCGPIQLFPGSIDILTNPVLIIEVLSPSTSNYGRTVKFDLYRLIPTLLDYVILHQNAIQAEHHSKLPDGSWLLTEYLGPDARILLPNIECELHLGSIYDGVMDEPV